jgi:hypothetical protein
VKVVEWGLISLFALTLLVIALWPLMPYVIGWLYLFSSWRFPA